MENASRLETCDICIVGTGAGGGILAYRLALSNLSVLSLEQGAPIEDSYFTNELDPEREPNFGISPEMPWPLDPLRQFWYDNLQSSRLYAQESTRSTSSTSSRAFSNRQVFRLNGKMNTWNGVALRYSSRDFRGLDHGDSDANWPLGYEDLKVHYADVERLIGVCGTREGLDNLPDGEYLPPKPLRPADRLLIQAVKGFRRAGLTAIPTRKAVETRPEQPHACRSCGLCVYGCRSGSIYKFSSRLLPRIVQRPNYRIRYECKVVRLHRSAETQCIETAECVNTRTREHFKVKAKAFVLAAGALESPRILLNSRDAAYPDGYANRAGLVGRYLQDNVSVNMGCSLLKLWGRRNNDDLGFGDNILIPRFHFQNEDFRGGYQAQFTHLLLKRPAYVEGLRLVFGRARKALAKLLFNSFVSLHLEGKPEARASNRLLTSVEPDLYGIPKVDVVYEWTENDRRMQASMLEQGRKILRACWGVFIQGQVMKAGEAVHYTGTCRMARNSKEGVVDADLRSFDHENLFVCDGSVIPELSEKNCSLTIMALAHRLGAHLSTCY